MTRLDTFYKKYKENYIQFKTLIDEGFQISHEFMYYKNPNNLAAKLQNELPNNVGNKVLILKNSIKKSK